LHRDEWEFYSIDKGACGPGLDEAVQMTSRVKEKKFYGGLHAKRHNSSTTPNLEHRQSLPCWAMSVGEERLGDAVIRSSSRQDGAKKP